MFFSNKKFVKSEFKVEEEAGRFISIEQKYQRYSFCADELSFEFRDKNKFEDFFYNNKKKEMMKKKTFHRMSCFCQKLGCIVGS